MNILIQNILHFISIYVKCILWQIFNEIVENKGFYRKKDDFWKKKLNKKFLFFNLKDFIFNKYTCKMYKLNNDLQLNIVEDQDLYRNKDDFQFFSSNKKFLYFDLKDLVSM